MIYRQFVKTLNGSPTLKSVLDDPIVHAELIAQGWEPLGWEMPKEATPEPAPEPAKKSTRAK